MEPFELATKYKTTGNQPIAIAELVKVLKRQSVSDLTRGYCSAVIQ